MDSPPPIFADASTGEKEPLWVARIGARKAFTWPGDELALGLQPLGPAQRELMARGEQFYAQCAACHGGSGDGISGLAPPLAGSSRVTGPPEWLARIILQGLTGPVTVQGETFDGVMPGHGHLAELDDATLAGLMTYLRRSWGNKADAVSVQTAASSRTASAGRAQPWTVAELEAVLYDRGYRRFEGQYSISFVTITITEKPDGLYISAPLYGGGKLAAVNETTFNVSVGDESAKIEFVADADGAVNALLLHRKGETITAQRKQ
jgi:mono/diheme cytochrome c family protein